MLLSETLPGPAETDVPGWLSLKENVMSLATILLLVLVLMVVATLPTWPHSRNWGYVPSGGLGLVLLIVAVVWLLGLV